MGKENYGSGKVRQKSSIQHRKLCSSCIIHVLVIFLILVFLLVQNVHPYRHKHKVRRRKVGKSCGDRKNVKWLPQANGFTFELKKTFFKRKEIISPRWEILLFENNNMAVLTSCEYSLYLAVKNKGWNYSKQWILFDLSPIFLRLTGQMLLYHARIFDASSKINCAGI